MKFLFTSIKEYYPAGLIQLYPETNSTWPATYLYKIHGFACCMWMPGLHTSLSCSYLYICPGLISAVLFLFSSQALPRIYVFFPMGPGTQRALISATAPPTGSTKLPKRFVSSKLTAVPSSRNNTCLKNRGGMQKKSQKCIFPYIFVYNVWMFNKAKKNTLNREL